jgi:hypothetical protein
MPTINIPFEDWPQFLETFSREHRAWLTTVEPSDDGVGEARPLGAVTAERDGRRISAIEISFAGDSGADIVRIENPTSMRVHRNAEGADRELEIVDDEGYPTRLGFRGAVKLEMPPGPLPSKVTEKGNER